MDRRDCEALNCEKKDLAVRDFHYHTTLNKVLCTEHMDKVLEIQQEERQRIKEILG